MFRHKECRKKGLRSGEGPSKAGHLGEKTKIFSYLDEVLKDYCFASQVTELSRRFRGSMGAVLLCVQL